MNDPDNDYVYGGGLVAYLAGISIVPHILARSGRTESSIALFIAILLVMIADAIRPAYFKKRLLNVILLALYLLTYCLSVTANLICGEFDIYRITTFDVILLILFFTINGICCYQFRNHEIR